MKIEDQEFVSAVVVLYNPTEEVLVNIRSYAAEVDKIYCIAQKHRNRICTKHWMRKGNK